MNRPVATIHVAARYAGFVVGMPSSPVGNAMLRELSAADERGRSCARGVAVFLRVSGYRAIHAVGSTSVARTTKRSGAGPMASNG